MISLRLLKRELDLELGSMRPTGKTSTARITVITLRRFWRGGRL